METQLGYDLNDSEKTALASRLSSKKTYQLKSPEGVIYTFDNKSKFSKEHGLNDSHIGKVLSGKIMQSNGWTLPETTLKAKKTYHLKSPEGVIHTFDDITAFVKNHNLPIKSIYEVLLGYSKQTKGWTLPIKIHNPKKLVTHQLKSPEGVIHTFHSISKFATEHNLNKGNLYMVLNGKSGQTNGWTLPETNFKSHREQVRIKHSKEFIVISPTGEVIHGRNIREFAKKYDLIPQALGGIINGKLRHHRAWTRYTGN